MRRGSYNRALLRAATELAPPALRIVIHELDEIPLYNADIEANGAPPGVMHLRDAIRQADGLLIATPEYNHGISVADIVQCGEPATKVLLINDLQDQPNRSIELPQRKFLIRKDRPSAV